MKLTGDFRETVKDRASREPAFRVCLREEAKATGEPLSDWLAKLLDAFDDD